MDPKILSTSRILWAAVRLKVLRMVSFSCRRRLESESSSAAARSGALTCGNTSMASEYIKTNMRNLCFNMANLQSLVFPAQASFFSSRLQSVQLLNSPVHSFFYCGIEPGILLKLLELRHRPTVMQVHQQINQRNLHQWRLPGLQSFHQSTAD